MRFVPWQYIADWKCVACGYCCKLYSVVLGFPEWLRIVKTFGVAKTVADLNHLYIKRTNDGSCSFLCRFANTYYCSLQNMKPDACKLWPFKVLSEPKYGQAHQAAFNYGRKKLFIYADAMCSGLRYGRPTWEFNFLALREFADLALGTRKTQSKTTSDLAFASRFQVRRLRLP
ncbi:MAG: YkgJ family cysteine cluster protein [Candidatus Bathyarchaeota archaeon]|nr:MAG: YkgJ family cysteine cluster protein [Candidatus Bathyarchaeota archaeon]